MDIGGSVQLTCSIDLSTAPPRNSLHLNRLSGTHGATCGMCDQGLAQPPDYDIIGECVDDTEADYAIQCEWNALSTVMTFTVTGLTDVEIAEWRCVSHGDPENLLSVTVIKFGRL